MPTPPSTPNTDGTGGIGNATGTFRTDATNWHRQLTLAVLAGWDRLPTEQLRQLVLTCPDDQLRTLLHAPGALTHSRATTLFLALLAREDQPGRLAAQLLTAAGLPEPVSDPVARQRLHLATTGHHAPQLHALTIPLPAPPASLENGISPATTTVPATVLQPRWTTTHATPASPSSATPGR